MRKNSVNTPATRFLKENKVKYKEHFYEYRKSGAKEAANLLEADPHCMIKTLIMEDSENNPFIILMHGDKEVSTKKLARVIKSKSTRPCSRRDTQRYTGYIIGGISPFGTRKNLPIYVEKTILDLTKMYVNGGLRGFIIEIEPSTFNKLMNPIHVTVAR